MKCARCDKSSETVSLACVTCQLRQCSDCLPIGAPQCNECSEGATGGSPPVPALNSVLAELLLAPEFHAAMHSIVRSAMCADRAILEGQGEKSPQPPQSTGHNGSTPIRTNTGAISKTAPFLDSDSKSGGHDQSNEFDNFTSRHANDTTGHDIDNHNVNNSTGTFVFEKSMALKEIERSIRLEPITKEQRAYRVNNTQLPAFAGDGCDWWMFYVAFTESTRLCNFSALENLKRLQDALSGRAKEKVGHLLRMPHKVDKIIAILKNEFTRPQVLMQNAVHLAEAVPILKDDLSNAAAFYVAVEKVRNVWDLIQGKYSDTLVLQVMEGRLSTMVARDWIHETPEDEADVQRFFAFVEKIYEESHRLQHLQRPNPASGRQQQQRQQVLVNAAGQGGLATFQCLMNCGKSTYHGLGDCEAFTAASLETRWAIVKQQKRCYNCLQRRHVVHTCQKNQQCRVAGCGLKHHPLLHFQVQQLEDEMIAVARAGVTHTLFRVVPVIVSSGNKSLSTYALMDTASSVTMMDAGLAKEMGLSGVASVMPIAWTDGKSRPVKTEKVHLTISSHCGAASFQIQAQTMAGMNLPVTTVDERCLQAEGLDDLPIVRLDQVKPLILIGQDNVELLVTQKSRMGSSRSMVASETPFGWMVEGQDKATPGPQRCMVTILANPEEDCLEKIVEQYIEAENFGLVPDDCVVMESDDDVYARKLMEKVTRCLGNRYETGLLWRPEGASLPNNYVVAEQRHQALMRKLRRNADEMEMVQEMLRGHEEKGYISRSQADPSHSWFLPIFTICNSRGKLRLVMDGAAEYRNVSLNSALVTGPDLTASLVFVLMRFRVGELAFSGDIQEMYLRVMMREEDRWAQQILWEDDGGICSYRMNVLPFGTTCSPSLAQYVKNANAQRFAVQFPDAVYGIVENTYVDDHLQSCHTEEEAIDMALTVRAIHRSGGFNMRKWSSNSPAVLSALGCESTVDPKEVSQTSFVLGMQWTGVNDLFSFRARTESLEELLRLDRPTKKQLLKLAMSIFDPLGLVAPISILARILLRNVCRYKVDMDDPLPEDLIAEWQRTVTCIHRLQKVTVPRWHGTISRNVDLHMFGDASESAFAATAYVVYTQDGRRQASLCYAKAKVTPLKYKSIPRLELDAAVLAVRLRETVIASRSWVVGRIVMWSDACDVLYWIRNHQRRYNVYVANRVGDILRATEKNEWRWVPTAQNPADLATKHGERDDDDLWWHGPTFLQEEEDKWPESCLEPDVVLDLLPVLHIKVLDLHPLIPPPENFSTWQRFLVNTAVAIAFPRVLMKKRIRGPVSAHEEEEARVMILQWVQTDLHSLDKGFLATLAPFKDEKDGLWRMNGRTAHASFLSYDERFPVILPKDHPVTRLIVRWFHQLSQHELVGRAMNDFRKMYVVDRMRSAFNAEAKECPRCILTKARPVAPQMAALPPCRLAVDLNAFTHCGVDIFGPFHVSRLRRIEKWYGMMMTCMTTRSTYLVLVPSLSGQSCWMAMDSLATRRFAPSRYYCDNGTNFVWASKNYRDPNGNRPEFVFNPPGTPHMGGAWERMIGVTKKALLALGLKTPTDELTLTHLFVLAEFIVNSRPLTDVPHAPGMATALTPMHILNGALSTQAERYAGVEQDLCKVADARNERVQEFWRRWTDEYLPTITRRTKWTKKSPPLQAGDVVYMCDTDYRVGWTRAIVSKVYQDPSSGQVRRALVRTGDGKEYIRPAVRLAKLNVRQD